MNANDLPRSSSMSHLRQEVRHDPAGGISNASSTESVLDDLSSKARSLFETIDQSGKGYIGPSELSECCSDLTPEELTKLFEELDRDGDGRISVTDFKEGLQTISKTLWMKTQGRRESRLSSLGAKSSSGSVSGDCLDDKVRGELAVFSEGLSTLACQEQVCELYQVLVTECPFLVDRYEAIILDILKELQLKEQDKEKLEELFKKERNNHSLMIRNMEDELEQQVKNVEVVVRKQETGRLDAEFRELLNNKQSEIDMLVDKIKQLEGMAKSRNSSSPSDASTIQTLRSQVSNLHEQNRQLETELAAARTQLAIARTDLSTLKQQYEEKCRDLQRERTSMVELLKEQNQLTQQLRLLQQMNRCLHDANDDLRCVIDGGNGTIGLSGSYEPSRRGSTMENYMIGLGHRTQLGGRGLPLCLLPTEESCEMDSQIEDSGLSTLRDVPDLESEASPRLSSFGTPSDAELQTLQSGVSRGETINLLEATTQATVVGYIPPVLQRPCTLQLPPDMTRLDEVDETCQQTDEDEKETRCHETFSPQPSPRSQRKRSSTTRKRSRTGSRSPRRPRSPASSQANTVSALLLPSPTVPPERMFKVVLAGDAAVGKSSFITRLCRNTFTNNTTSTLGVDFQNKSIEVDGHVFALQLWDTAGQERFRSIARSYFRRADGVLCLYDCTYERSFISVREWINIIQESAPNPNIPIMLVANKTDMRDQAQQEGRRVVTYQDGRRLAQDCNALFIETSAKDGSNIMEAVIELARLLRAQEDLEVSKALVHVTQMSKPKKSGSNCCDF